MKTMCPLVYHHSGFVELYIQNTVKKYNSTTRKYNSTFLIYIYIYIDRYIYIMKLPKQPLRNCFGQLFFSFGCS